MLVQQGLDANPFDGAVYAFRGRRAGLINAHSGDHERSNRSIMNT
jgi:hypothetical protein